ncbi:hypothetical protein D3C81_1325560 [compost metagenome]
MSKPGITGAIDQHGQSPVIMEYRGIRIIRHSAYSWGSILCSIRATIAITTTHIFRISSTFRATSTSSATVTCLIFSSRLSLTLAARLSGKLKRDADQFLTGIGINNASIQEFLHLIAVAGMKLLNVFQLGRDFAHQLCMQ